MMFFLCFWPYSQESTCVGASKVPNFCKNTYFDEHLQTVASEFYVLIQGNWFLFEDTLKAAYFHGSIRRPIPQMIPSTQWWVFLPHVHLKMLEEIDVLQGILMEFILLVFQLEETLAKMIHHARK